MGGHLQVDEAFRLSLPRGFALFLPHGLGEQPQIHLVPHRLHMAVLLGAQQVARAPDLHIPHGDFEAGAEFGEFPDSLQPLGGHVGEHLSPHEGEVGEGAAGGAAHPAPELMELGQAVAVGVFDDQGVDVGDIHPRLDDGGAHQDVQLMLQHLPPDIRELLLGHFAVGEAHPGLGQAHLDPRRTSLDGFHPVVEVIHLAAPAQFPPDGIDEDAVVVLQHIGLHRPAVLGRFFDDRHIPYAAHGHVQRPGDGSGRKGENVHVGGQFFHPFLLGHAEPLLLIHDEEPQIVELHILGKHPMGAHQNIHLSPGGAAQDVLLLLGRAEAGEHLHLNGETFEPPHDGVVVLKGQDGGGDKQDALLALGNTLESGPQRHLRFTEAHVPAQQPVHGDRTLHIPLDLVDAA